VIIKIPSNLKCVATLPCKILLTALNTNISQGSAATHLRLHYYTVSLHIMMLHAIYISTKLW